MNIRKKLLIIFMILCIVPATLIGVLGFFHAQSVIQKQAFEKENTFLKRQTESIQNFLNQYISQTKLTADYPPVQGIIRASKNGIDPKDGSTTLQWKKRLQSIFSSMIRSDENLLQVRYLNEQGKELVRVNSEHDIATIVLEKDLQNKASRDYFTNTMKLNRNAVYISDLNLNRENGEIEKPYQPVIRFSIPIFDIRNNTRKGIVILNISTKEIFRSFNSRDFGNIFLTDQDGYYLHHHDKDKEFSKDLNPQLNYFKNQPEVVTNMKNRTYKLHHDKDSQQLRSWRKIFYNPFDQNKFWMVFTIIDESSLFAPINQMKSVLAISIGVLALILLVVIYYTAHTLSNPIEYLKTLSDKISNGELQTRINPKLLKRNDEIGFMAKSLQNMLTKLISANTNLEKKVQSRTIELNNKLVELDEKNKNISEAKNQIEKREAQISTILNTAVDAIITLDEQGNILTFNQGAENIFGFSSYEIKGKSINTIIPEPQDFWKNIIQSNKKDKIQNLNKNIFGVKNNESHFPVSLSSGKSQIEDEIIYTIILQDITQIKKVEKMKNEFISVVSHELRTPLTSIKGSLGLITEKAFGEIPIKLKKLIQIASDNCERLVRLINDILDIEKIESGKQELKMKPQNIIPLLEQSIENNIGFAKKYNVHLEFQNQTSQDSIIINCDNDAIMQILTNLLSNAIKYSPENDTVTLGIIENEGMLKVDISDNGTGIPKSYQEKIFQKFTQADSSITRKKGGTGLGLSISKALVEKMGGKIGFKTEENKGTTFSFELPMLISKQPNLANTNSVMPAKTKGKILICEDDNDVADIIRMIFVEYGYNVDIAYTAKSAKNLLEKTQYDVFVLDVFLPDQNGLELLEEIRQQPKNKDLPTIIISAELDQAKSQFKGNALNIIDWIYKPLEKNRILNAVKQAADKSPNAKPFILYVEDNLDTVQIIKEILNETASVDLAQSIAEAQEKLSQSVYDLILLDLKLPDGSGMELLPIIKSQSNCPPVILFSAYNVTQKDANHFSAVLTKSQTSNLELLNVIESNLKNLSTNKETSEEDSLKTIQN